MDPHRHPVLHWGYDGGSGSLPASQQIPDRAKGAQWAWRLETEEFREELFRELFRALGRPVHRESMAGGLSLPTSPPEAHQHSSVFLWVTLGKDIPPLPQSPSS